MAFDLADLKEACVQSIASELRSRDFHSTIDSSCRSEYQARNDAEEQINAMSNLDLLSLIGNVLAEQYPNA